MRRRRDVREKEGKKKRGGTRAKVSKDDGGKEGRRGWEEKERRG